MVASCEKRGGLWIYEQYRRHYNLYIKDFDSISREYRIPLFEVTVQPGDKPDALDPMNPSAMLPPAGPSPRLTLFPQTRFSFIEDTVQLLLTSCLASLIHLLQMLHTLYPMPKDQSKNMAYRLLRWFQGNVGYYNTLATPFAESFVQVSHSGDEYQYLAAMYPIITIENAVDYEHRKTAERFLRSVQQKGPRDFPLITQARYSRRFDFQRESRLWSELSYNDVGPEAVQSGRALFEYSCGDLDTITLDLERTMDIESENEQTPLHQLILVEPLWTIVFPSSSKSCECFNMSFVLSDLGHVFLYRNEKIEDRNPLAARGLWDQTSLGSSISWAYLFTHALDKIDKYRAQYMPLYRVRLARIVRSLSQTMDSTLTTFRM